MVSCDLENAFSDFFLQNAANSKSGRGNDHGKIFCQVCGNPVRISIGEELAP